MSSATDDVVLEVDPGVPVEAAASWAAREAHRRGADLRIVLAEPGDTEAGREFTSTLAAVRVADPAAGATVEPAHDALPETRRSAAARAGLHVVPAPVRDLPGLLAAASCPVAVVPGRPPADAAAPVLLAVGPATAPQVLEFAFAAAALRSAPVLAVRVWQDRRVELGRPLAGHLARWDAAQARVRDELDARLAAVAARHPEVPVRQVVVQDTDPAGLLLALAGSAQLAVVGLPGSPARRSPALALARHAPCPVVIVPSAVVPPRQTPPLVAAAMAR